MLKKKKRKNLDYLKDIDPKLYCEKTYTYRCAFNDSNLRMYEKRSFTILKKCKLLFRYRLDDILVDIHYKNKHGFFRIKTFILYNGLKNEYAKIIRYV